MSKLLSLSNDVVLAKENVEKDIEEGTFDSVSSKGNMNYAKWFRQGNIVFITFSYKLTSTIPAYTSFQIGKGLPKPTNNQKVSGVFSSNKASMGDYLTIDTDGNLNVSILGGASISSGETLVGFNLPYFI